MVYPRGTECLINFVPFAGHSLQNLKGCDLTAFASFTVMKQIGKNWKVFWYLISSLDYKKMSCFISHKVSICLKQSVVNKQDNLLYICSVYMINPAASPDIIYVTNESWRLSAMCGNKIPDFPTNTK